MTLSTDVLLTKPVMPDTVWEFVTRELLQRPDYRSSDETKDGRIERWGEPGQGATAWSIMKWIPDAPITATSWEYDDSDEGKEVVVAHGSVLLDFDTAYGFREGGAGCSDLHAYFILALSEEFGNVVAKNEFTGEWFSVPEQMDKLLELGDPKLGERAVKAEAA